MEILPGLKILNQALYCNNTLIISDIHIGYEEMLNKRGFLIPRLQFEDMLKRIEEIFALFKSKKVERVIGGSECFTSIVSIAEIVEWCLRNNRDYEDRIERIKALSKILNLNNEITKLAGKINFKHKKIIKDWGMMDSLIYATAKLYGLKVLTGDEHFRNLENAVML